MKKILVLFLMMLSLAAFVSAEEFDGYIVKIKENTYENMTSVSVFGGEMMLFSEMDDSEICRLMADEIPEVSDVSCEHLYVKADDKETLDMLVDMGVVESYEEDVYMELFGYDISANAKYYSQQWFYDTINASFAWDAGICGNDVKVAIIDSGIYPNKDIVNNLLTGYNYYANEANYDPYDTYDYSASGHGTMVAGLVAAECNAISTVGLAFNAKVVPLKVTDGSTFSLSYAVSAIYDAVDDFECDVINMSFGSTVNSGALYDAVTYAINKNVIVVAASGNNGNKTIDSVTNPKMYPAYYDEVISVANAESYEGTMRIFKSSTFNDKVDITAPGTEVASLYNNDNNAAKNTGTSFSSPIVAAAAALAKGINPDITVSEFTRVLKQTADSSYITALQDSNYWGAGMLDVEALLRTLLAGKTVYLSDVQNCNGEYIVIATNLSSVNNVDECSVTFSEFDVQGGALTKFETVTFELPAGTSKTLSASELGMSKNAVTSLILDHVPGDVDGDGKVNNRDASAVLRYIAGYAVSYVEAAIDVNGDGKINNRDASAILRHISGYEVELH